ncbi:MAG: YihY/virulence factor BrkB family protein [Bacteroidota bacterium]|nr:YihY/virulence factor BrkB family protein [Bacteroidota bacterium]MDP4216381.1 YihY/virulence factor BrkB family protein [Bacteroidota bacterium]MDP4245524.1 YihY/virulence factor BrkB family protein [Bacteroidota bacterium]MDP4255628.1 YihY/virulence factor BrkB family protein [Bacteroidota bacterium]MDP4258973.1 YihY/virulence factor BrkB family protein [Bacteroidota bacterium]
MMTRIWIKVKLFLHLLRDALRIFQQNDPLRMAAATAFFAGFALPPIMIILIEVLGLFGDPRAIGRGLFDQLGHAMDPNTVVQIRSILHNVRQLSLSEEMRVGGFVFLVFVATTLFEVVKSSMNQLWRIRLKGRRAILDILLYRIKSIGIIILAGLLFLVVLLGDTTGWLLGRALYRVVAMLAIIAWFVMLLKYLADGRPSWKVAIGGGVFTGLLFAIGVVILRWLLSFSKAETIYGSSTALTLLLLFVFYSAFIFYYGACFTLALAERWKLPIRPTAHAAGYSLENSGAVPYHQSTLPSGDVDGRQSE